MADDLSIQTQWGEYNVLFIEEYSPNCVCSSSLPIAYNIGLSYSSTRMTTRCPVFLQARWMIPAKRREKEVSDGRVPYRLSNIPDYHSIFYPDHPECHIFLYWDPDVRELITESRLHLHKIVDSAFVYKNSALTGRNANQMYIPGVLPRAWR